MATTWSFKLLALTSRLRRTASVSLRMCLNIDLKFHPRFPGRCGQGFHASVVHVSSAIEYDFFNSRRAGSLGDFLADQLRRRDVVAALELLAHFLVDRARRDQRAPRDVFDHLGVDVP